MEKKSKSSQSYLIQYIKPGIKIFAESQSQASQSQENQQAN